MKLIEFIKTRQLIEDLVDQAAFCKVEDDDGNIVIAVVEDECVPLTTSFVPFSENGTVLSVPRRVEFKPTSIPFRTYDTELVRQMSLNPVRTYRGDLNDLFAQLSAKANV